MWNKKTEADESYDINIVISMYSLIEYSDA